MSERQTYSAFISYSHRDARWAAWIQKSIERYRVPARLRGSEGAFGPVPDRLGRAFRDRDELAAAVELSDSVGQALRDSLFLVVICSPAAAQSRWVAQEILEFKRLGGANRILCLVVDGDPAAEDENACFPEPLLYAPDEAGKPGSQRTEPLAADVRPTADGKTLARQKILAGLLGVPLDALRQREQQRRQKVFGAIAASSLAGMALTSWLAWSAMLAREDAERRQSQAEALVEFILSDLHEGLRKVGRLDVMRSAALEAQAYFAGLDVRDLTSQALQGHAESLRQIGDLQLNQGQPAEAYAAFREAWRMDSELLSRQPDDAELQFNLGQSEFWLGYARLEAGADNEALEHFNRYMEISRQLYERDPSRIDWVMELCYAHNNLASVMADQGQPEAAALEMQQAVRYNLEALELAPDSQDLLAELAISEGWLATILRASGQLTASVEPRVSSRLRWERLFESDPGNAENRFELAGALRREGVVLAALGRSDEAMMAFDRALDHYAALRLLDPANLFWSQEQAGTMADRAGIANFSDQDRQAFVEIVTGLADIADAGGLDTPRGRARLSFATATAAALLPGNRALIPRALAWVREAHREDFSAVEIMALRAGTVVLAQQSGYQPDHEDISELTNSIAQLQTPPADPVDLAALIAFQLETPVIDANQDWLDALWQTGYRHPAFVERCAVSLECVVP